MYNSIKMRDLIIVGAGVAGLTASIYASRYKINHLVFGEVLGGQGLLAGKVENYPGHLSISGPELMQKFVEQAKSYGVEIKNERVGEAKRIISRGEGYFEIKTKTGVYQTKTLILAMGASFKRLEIPGEEEFLSRGVSYCTVCDAPLFRDKVVAVVGGGDSAVTGAIHVASFANKVYLIHRREEYRAEPTWVQRMRENPQIEEVLGNTVKEILGAKDERLVKEVKESGGEEGRVAGVLLEKPYKGENILLLDGVFIEIGQVPSSVLAKELGVDLDEKGYIKVAPTMATNIPGVFAAGDLAAVEGGVLFRQFITAAADGARAAASVYQYLNKGEAPAPSWG